MFGRKQRIGPPSQVGAMAIVLLRRTLSASGGRRQQLRRLQKSRAGPPDAQRRSLEPGPHGLCDQRVSGSPG